MTAEANYKTQPAAYNSWASMIQRCTNPRHAQYGKYSQIGGICARWRSSFASFFADMGPRPAGMTLDRIDNEKGYWCGVCAECKEAGRAKNCRWAGRVTQANNSGRKHAVFIGATPTVAGVMLREWREANQYSLARAGQIIGLTPHSMASILVQRFEDGSADPSITQRARMERAAAIDPALWFRPAAKLRRSA